MSESVRETNDSYPHPVVCADDPAVAFGAETHCAEINACGSYH